MIRKLMPIVVASSLLVTLFCVNSVAWSFERHTPNAIPQDQISPPSTADPERPAAFCEIINDTDTPAYYYDSLIQGSGTAVYMNPKYCGPSPYPFKITDVHFYLYEFDASNRWPVLLRVNIRELSQGDSCTDTGQVVCSEDFSVPADSAYPLMLTYELSTPCCVNNPFFLEIIYTETFDLDHRNPSLLMEPETPPPDTCDNWMKWDGDYYEWWDFWSPPPPGNAMIRVTGYTQDPDCGDLWYWKPDTAHAPSGMPDFDQNQDQWVAYCGPAAVANCLWWFDAVPVGWTPPQLIDTLARYFKTNPVWGTFVDTMQMGLEQYFSDYGFALQESTFQIPDFFEMEDSLKRCQDIILLLGFWYYSDQLEQWFREGGHFVTMAGVCSESLKIAISDPDRDAAEGGWPGRVRPPVHPPHPGDALLHNGPTYVCHDMYQSILDNPFPSPGNPFWEIDYVWAKGRYSGLNVPEEFRSVTRPAPMDGKDLFVTEVEYAVMICPKSTAVEGEEGSSTPRDFQLYQNYPNPFNNETVIKFNLRRPAEVSLAIYNILGQKVRTLVEGRLNAGS
ncbi:MAG: T9SS type A sorting domain-containing protein, partial [Candidatus Zixiibacteriota bacterium]